jgi:eukaryotic-like serine/threonine-protein kinase
MHRLVRRKCHPRSGQRFTAGGRRYEFKGAIGDGAVGLVRKARDLASDKIVAVKVLAPDPKYIDEAAFDDVEQRFRREGIRGAHLEHENLVKILAYEDNENGKQFERAGVKNPFLVMEYVAGRTLESLIRRMAQTYPSGQIHVTKQTLHIASRVARALDYLHTHKIIHRDVKPANIFLSTATLGNVPSLVKLGDFGVTKWGDFLASAASGTLTVTRQQGLGTMKYMSPEQAVRPKEVTVRSDIFSLGITLFELFTGQVLGSQHHVFEIMSARTSRDSIIGKLLALGITSPYHHTGTFELILDMFLSSPKGRPTSSIVCGRMEHLLEIMDEDTK